jgi:hypothetical protein
MGASSKRGLWQLPALCTLLLALAPTGCSATAAKKAGPRLNKARASRPSVVTRPPLQDESYRYHVRFDEGLSSVEVELCAPRPVTELQPSSPGGKPFLEEAKQGSLPCRIKDGVAMVPKQKASCIRYRVNLGRLFDSAHGMNGALRLGDAALLSPDLWLWTPEPRDKSLPVQLKVQLPPGMSLALPWSQAGQRWVRVPESSFVWKMQGAVGRYRSLSYPFQKGRLEVALLRPGWGDRTALVLDWLKQSTQVVSDALGGMPSKRVQVVLVPKAVGHYGFGYATRGGGDAVALLVDPAIGPAELKNNWMAVHELLHFALPTMSNEHAWLYEGLVTYLAAVVRAKAGMVTPSFAWGELLDGFTRGSSSGTGKTLRGESAGMLKTGSFWRVYWWGALVALELDVALHRKGKSLLGVLRGLQLEPFERVGDYSAEEVLGAMDRVAGETIFVATARRHLDSKTFPDFGSLSGSLGLRLKPDQTARLNDAAPDAVIRRSITERWRNLSPRPSLAPGPPKERP